MKRKFLILTLCFTLIFSSFNYKKSYADGGVISLPMLATVSSLAVATGITINGNDDLYDIGKLFVNYINKQNELTWDVLNATFTSGVSVLKNGLVSVDSNFLNIVKDFFDDTFSDTDSDIFAFGDLAKINHIPLSMFTTEKQTFPQTVKVSRNGEILTAVLKYYINSNSSYVLTTEFYDSNGSLYSDVSFSTRDSIDSMVWVISPYSNAYSFIVGSYKDGNIYKFNRSITFDILDSAITFPYNGGYTWDNVENKKENDSIALPIPGDLGQLVGQGSTDFWDNTDNLVGVGGVTIPNVDSPSVSVDDTISFPNVGDVPNDTPSDTPFSNITEYIIGLVVPSDSYWTDTFGGLHNNFINSFPMVDMSEFNNLVVNGKPFPNIDVEIMGSEGRVVNGDTVNSIVDWLRPIVAGFVFLCLMFFNYRKLYKLIRNSEPFEGIGKVENHAN